MALIVETGSGSATANSYLSLEAAASYFADAGQGPAWGSVANKSAALILATQHVEAVYAGQWSGSRSNPLQRLSWPRAGVSVDGVDLPSDEIPSQLLAACAELALRSTQGALLEDEDREVIRETIGPITQQYSPGSRRQKRYALVDALLSVLIGGAGSGTTKVLRS